MPKRTSEQVLAEFYWGWQTVGLGETDTAFRAPLPPTERFPMGERGCGNIDGMTQLQIPPYIAAAIHGGRLHVDLYGGDGWRVGYNSKRNDESACLYPDSDDLPGEWKQPIAAALDEIQQHWPGRQLIFRAKPDVDLPMTNGDRPNSQDG